MTNALLIAMMLLLSMGADDVSLPDELSGLKDLAPRENELVDAVRAYDREQTPLAERDSEMAVKHARAGEHDLAKEKKQSARTRLENVRKAYEYALKHWPNNAKAQTYYGETLYDHFGDVAGALRAWQLATALDPKLSTPLNDLAIHYCHEGQYAMGLDYYDRAIKLDPKNPDYLFNLAQMYLVNFPFIQKARKWEKARVYREAMKLSKKASDLAPDDFDLAQDYAVNFFAAADFGVKADWKKAATAWQKTRTLARKPDETFYTWLNEGRVWLQSGKKDKAAACIEEALKIIPDSETAQRLLSEARSAPKP